MDLWEIYKASKGVPITSDMYDALFGKALGGAGSVWETETAPYFFRQSGGLLNSRLLGKEKDCIVGASVGFNQLVNSGDTSVTVTSGHKYYANINGSKTIGSSNGSAISINDSTKDNVVDLTFMLGSTIADYAYSLETQQSGKGVKWLKDYGFFSEPYYAYDSGSIKSVSGLSAHKCVGFNAWDEEWEVGSIDSTTGDNSPTTTQIRSKGYIPCLPNTQYYFQSPRTGNDVRIAFYRSDKSYRSMSGWSYNGIFTTPDDCYYIRFYMASAYGTTYNHDICINLSWDGSRDGEYEPYQKWSYPLDSDLELRGIPKIENGNLYYDGDVYEADGTVTRKCGIVVLDGTQSASAFVKKDNTVRRMIVGADINQAKNASNICRIIADCPTYTPDYVYINDVSGVSENKNMTSSGIWVAIEKSKLSEVSVQGFNDYLSQHPITVVYPLETPTTESADSYTSPQTVDKNGTEEYVCTQKFVPVGHETEYKCEPTP